MKTHINILTNHRDTLMGISGNLFISIPTCFGQCKATSRKVIVKGMTELIKAFINFYSILKIFYITTFWKKGTLHWRTHCFHFITSLFSPTDLLFKLKIPLVLKETALVKVFSQNAQNRRIFTWSKLRVYVEFYVQDMSLKHGTLGTRRIVNQLQGANLCLWKCNTQTHLIHFPFV